MAERATIAVATNFKTTMDDLQAAFEATSTHNLQVVVGSTGKLYAQIHHGAPYDVFLAADKARPLKLATDGDGIAETRFTYANGRLALWGRNNEVDSKERLLSANFNRLAIANPDLAPYGLAAQQVLERLAISNNVSRKLVLGESVGQTFAFVGTGNAELGLVSLAQVRALSAARQGEFWLVPDDMHDPIAQQAILLGSGADNQAAISFLTFLRGPAAAQIIASHGYETE